MGQPDHGGGNAPLFTALGFAAIAGFLALAAVTSMIGAASIPIWGMAVGGSAIVFRGPVGKAIARRIGGGEPGEMPPELPADILGELGELRNRVMELEERVDFSERLLAQPGHRGPGEQPHA